MQKTFRRSARNGERRKRTEEESALLNDERRNRTKATEEEEDEEKEEENRAYLLSPTSIRPSPVSSLVLVVAVIFHFCRLCAMLFVSEWAVKKTKGKRRRKPLLLKRDAGCLCSFCDVSRVRFDGEGATLLLDSFLRVPRSTLSQSLEMKSFFSNSIATQPRRSNPFQKERNTERERKKDQRETF